MTAMRMTVLLCFLLLATPQIVSAGEMERRSRIGLITGFQSRSDVGLQVIQESGAMTTFGCRAGVGFDLGMGRSFVAIADLGYNLMTDFSDEIGGRRSYSGLEFGLGIGWQFGGSAHQ